jgi:hypothetical protein
MRESFTGPYRGKGLIISCLVFTMVTLASA